MTLASMPPPAGVNGFLRTRYNRNIRANGKHIGEPWLLVTASSAGAPDSLRVAIWRKLRSLGVLYVQQSVCVVPARPDVRREIRRLVDRVEVTGGSARALTIRFDDPDEEAQIVAELQAARDGEYGEVLDRVPAFLNELRSERERDRATYEEVEESEADLERFRTWLAKIASRDYFAAPAGQQARDAVQEATDALAGFEEAALNAEAPEPAPPGRTRRLRVADRS
jgi:hypothetical protein